MHILLTPGEPRGLQKYFIRGTTLFISLGFSYLFVLQTSQFAFILRSFYLAVFFGNNTTINLSLLGLAVGCKMNYFSMVPFMLRPHLKLSKSGGIV